MNFVNRWFFSKANQESWAVQFNEILTELEIVFNGNLDSSNFTSTILTGKYCKSKTFGGHILANEMFGIFYAPGTISITKLFLSIGEEADADILVEVYKNDVATGQIATLTSGAKSEMTTLGTALSFIEDDKVSLKLTACGTDSAPGQDLDVDIYYKM